jgi:hypothetical protein
LHVQFYILEVKTAPYFLSANFIRVKADSMGDYPTPRLIDGYMAAEPVERYFLRHEVNGNAPPAAATLSFGNGELW